MGDSDPIAFDLSVLTFREIRRYLRRSHAVMMAVFIGLVYALGSMLLGGMLILTSLSGGYTTEILWGSGTGVQPWNYPGLLVIAPWGIVELPFFATLSMILVAIGVGAGMSVALLLSIQLVRQRRTQRGPVTVSSFAGLTPAMIALVTLGACCSTTAAATAGVALVARASGSTADNLLLNNWYLGVFQIVVVLVALVAQELVLRVYGGLTADPATASTVTPSDTSGRSLPRGLLRLGLLVAGVTWALSAAAEWATLGGAPGAGTIFRWAFEHEAVGVLAIVVALFPIGMARAIRDSLRSVPAVLVRVAALLGGATLLIGAPYPLSAWGVEGLGNELLGLAGAPTGWGAVAPVFPPGLDLYLRWGFQYALLGGFAVLLAVAPAATLRWVRGPPSKTAVAATDADRPARSVGADASPVGASPLEPG